MRRRNPRCRGCAFWLLGLLACVLGGCATVGERVALVLPVPDRVTGPADAPRLAVAPLQDWRDKTLEEAHEGLFRESLSEEAVEGGLTHAVTRAVADRLRACGQFAEVSLGEVWSAEPKGVAAPDDGRRADLLLEGEIATFYAERDTTSHPFLSLAMAPLGIPLAALSGLRVLPTPTIPFLPVVYRSTVTLQLRLRDARSGEPLWERTLEGIAELESSAAAEFFDGKSSGLREVATAALQRAVQQTVRSLPSAEWLRMRHPKAPASSAPAVSFP